MRHGRCEPNSVARLRAQPARASCGTMCAATRWGHATVFAVGAGGGGLRRFHAVRHEAPDRRRSPPGPRPGDAASGGRSRCCARWSPPTTCCGASAAGPRPAPSSRSPATSGATCSRICPATRRATSPSACPARWPAGSPPPPTPRSPPRTPASGTCCRRAWRWSASIVLHRLGEPDDGRRAGGVAAGAGRAGLLPGAPRHAAASQLRRQGRRGGRRAGRRDRQHGRGARVRRDVARAAAHRRARSASRWPRAARSLYLSGEAAADPCGADRDR